MSCPTLSVILPLRCSGHDSYRIDRLAANLTLLGGYDDVECVVVDSASSRRCASRIRSLCEGRARVRRVVDPAPQQPFAPGSTRNVGAQHASGDFVLSYDVDLCCDADFVPAVLRWTRATRDPRDFLVLPCLFLTRQATERIDFTGKPVDLGAHRAALFADDDHVVSHFAATHVAVSRRHFLRLGGYRPEYRGHGCEDFDLLHRLCSYRPLGKRPTDYTLDFKTRLPGDYRGFRAYFASYALPHLFDGLLTAHLWHPRPLLRPYFRRRDVNEALLQERMRMHDAGVGPLAPLPALPAGAVEPLAPLAAPWGDEGETPAPPIAEQIDALMLRHGHDPTAQAGLLRSRKGPRRDRGSLAARLRKLVLHPREFLADSAVPALRVLGRWFPPATRD